MFKNKSLLITGEQGLWYKCFRAIKKKNDLRKIIIFSRDEISSFIFRINLAQIRNF